ncbi:MAG TPA: orotidine-5'-phosphate decarboxylase [Armatimonadota bacterium]|nr:orotidine-5'-phosphate decarboxylase [Armatimonadota bacterium]HQK95429.1 orotidine-5'-phosphate decarboxylase [Armatimonadota bacterium]
MNFADRLFQRVRDTNSRVVVGLDPAWDSLPDPYRAGRGREGQAQCVESFCRRIIDAVSGLCAAVKPQAAFFEALGAPGWSALEGVCAHAHAAGIPVILDAKRGDIGSTSAAYARGLLIPAGPLDLGTNVDALTVNPYLGSDGIGPFIDACRAHDKGLFVLVKTSNPSSAELQDLQLSSAGRPMYEAVASAVSCWGGALQGVLGYSAIGAVVGATHPAVLEDLRDQFPRVPFLVPGFGAQGAQAADVARAFGPEGLGAVVNSSRGILFAFTQEPYRSEYGGDRFDQAAADACRRMRDEINLAADRKS